MLIQIMDRSDCEIKKQFLELSLSHHNDVEWLFDYLKKEGRKL